MNHKKTPQNHFDLLGMPSKFAIDLNGLEKNYLEIAAAIHPDRYQDTTHKAAAEEKIQQIHHAYNLLKDDLKRGSYLLKLNSSESPPQLPSLDPEMLTFFFMLNEEIDEKPPPERQEEIRSSLKNQWALTVSSLDGLFSKSTAPFSDDLHVLISSEIIRLRYIKQTLLKLTGSS